MQLYPDILFIIITILVLYLLYQHLCGCNSTSGNKIENFTDLPGMNQEAVQALASVVDKNYLTMPYMIVMYKGGANMVPAGWALCDGQNGTPDLRDKFVVCAGSTKALNSTGGGQNRLTVANLPAHTHLVNGSTSTDGNHRHRSPRGKCADKDDGSGGPLASGDNNNNENCNASDIMESAGNHSHTININSKPTGSGAPFNAEPPYYALSFIMKLPPVT